MNEQELNRVKLFVIGEPFARAIDFLEELTITPVLPGYRGSTMEMEEKKLDNPPYIYYSAYHG